MIKFKQGWFTLIKFDHEVFDKNNTKAREELVEFSQSNRIEKPPTWIQGLQIDNKFKEEKPMEEFKRSQTVAKPKSQSKVALKLQRQKEKASGAKLNRGLTGFRKMNLKLGGGKEEIPEEVEEIKVEETKVEEQLPEVQKSSEKPKLQKPKLQIQTASPK